MPATEAQGMAMVFDGREYPVDRKFTTLDTSVNQHYSLPDKIMGYPVELAEPLEITCKVEFGSLRDLIPQQESIFNFCFSDRQKKRRRRHLRRNKKRSNGTKRNKSSRVHNRPLIDFNAIAIDVKMSNDRSTMTFKKVKGERFKL